MPGRPSMARPVGKSGPFTCFIKSSSVISGSSIWAQMPSMISPRLCGGMFVAMPTAAGLEILLDAGTPEHGAAGREIRSLHVLHQIFERDFRIVDLGADAVDDFAEIMRRHVR